MRIKNCSTSSSPGAPNFRSSALNNHRLRTSTQSEVDGQGKSTTSVCRSNARAGSLTSTGAFADLSRAAQSALPTAPHTVSDGQSMATSPLRENETFRLFVLGGHIGCREYLLDIAALGFCVASNHTGAPYRAFRKSSARQASTSLLIGQRKGNLQGWNLPDGYEAEGVPSIVTGDGESRSLRMPIDFVSPRV